MAQYTAKPLSVVDVMYHFSIQLICQHCETFEAAAGARGACSARRTGKPKMSGLGASDEGGLPAIKANQGSFL